MSSDYDLFTFPEFISENQKLEQIEFGSKIGCKIENDSIKWIEKWAHFQLMNSDK